MNTGIIFIVFQILDLLIDPVFAAEVFTKFQSNSPEIVPKVLDSPFNYCEDEAASWNIYCIGYKIGNNPQNSWSKLVVKKPGDSDKVELATTIYDVLIDGVLITEYPKRGCIIKGTYRTEDPPNSPPLIEGKTSVPFYIDYEFSGCMKEDAGEYDCELKDDVSGNFEPSSNAVIVTFNRDNCTYTTTTTEKSIIARFRETGNNALKPTGYPMITLVGIVTITMIN